MTKNFPIFLAILSIFLAVSSPAEEKIYSTGPYRYSFSSYGRHYNIGIKGGIGNNVHIYADILIQNPDWRTKKKWYNSTRPELLAAEVKAVNATSGEVIAEYSTADIEHWKFYGGYFEKIYWEWEGGLGNFSEEIDRNWIERQIRIRFSKPSGRWSEILVNVDNRSIQVPWGRPGDTRWDANWHGRVGLVTNPCTPPLK